MNDNSDFSSSLVKNVSIFTFIITIFSGLGWLIYESIIGTFNFPSVSVDIVNTINYVFDLIFSSVNILGFFIRSSTLVFVAKCFCFFYILKLEFKFSKFCISLASKMYSLFKNVLGSLTSLLTGFIGKII